MPFFEVTPEGFADVVATNLTGYFLVARTFAPLFIEQGKGRFGNVSRTMDDDAASRSQIQLFGPTAFNEHEQLLADRRARSAPSRRPAPLAVARGSSRRVLTTG